MTALICIAFVLACIGIVACIGIIASLLRTNTELAQRLEDNGINPNGGES